MLKWKWGWKRTVLITLLLAGLALGYLFYLSWLGGFILSKYCGGKTDGVSGRIRSIVVTWHGHRVHLHHWLLSALVGIIGTLTGLFLVAPWFFYGFLSGLIFQGIYCYGDWHRIVTRQKGPAGESA